MNQQTDPAAALQAMVRFSLLCVREDSLQVLLDGAAEVAREVTHTDLAKVLELRPNGSLFVRAGVGWPPGIVGAVEIPLDSDSQASYAVRLKRPVVVPDLASEARFAASELFLSLGVRSGANVIIEYDNRVFGVLEVDDYSPRDYSATELDVLTSLANLLAVAIGRRQYEEERDQLVNVAAHELRNPVSIILAFAQRLSKIETGAQISATETVALRELFEGAQRMQRLIDLLLDLGRIEGGRAPEVREVSLSDMLRDLVVEAATLYPNVAITADIPVATVESDEAMARLVLSNIIQNAAKYSTTVPEVRVTAVRQPEGLLVNVRDGCGGISADDLDRLFERFFRGQSSADIRGFGLGLFVAHRTAELLDWRIHVRNVGAGCEFQIGIPDRQPDAADGTPSPTEL